MKFNAENFIQIEAAECGLSCMAAAAVLLGSPTDLEKLRARYGSALRGHTLQDLIHIASDLQLSSRPVHCEFEELRLIGTPAILHWAGGHFVVLREARDPILKIFDPAVGDRQIPLAEARRMFSGVALELSCERIPGGHVREPLEGARSRGAEVYSRKPPIFSEAALGLFMASLMLGLPALFAANADRLGLPGAALPVLSLGLLLALGLQVSFRLSRVWAIESRRTRGALEELFKRWLSSPLTWLETRLQVDAFDVLESFERIARDRWTSWSAELTALLVLGGGLLAMAYIHPLVALLNLVGLTAAAFVHLRVVSGGSPRWEGAKLAAAAARNRTDRALRALRGLKAAGLERPAAAQLAAAQAMAIRRRGIALAWADSGLLMHDLLDGVLTILTIYLAGVAFDAGRLEAGGLIAVIAYRTLFSQAVRAELELLARRLTAGRDRRRYGALLAPEGQNTGEASGPASFAAVELRNVSVRYGPGRPLALSGINLTIEQGECVAVAGPCAAGKSTLLEVICGLRPAESGQVWIDGQSVPFTGEGRSETRIGAALQYDEISGGSIADNVAYFDQTPNLARVRECLEHVLMFRAVRNMPMRLKTLVGKGGFALSGRQRQSLLVARALYQKPNLLLFDETLTTLDLSAARTAIEAARRLGCTQVIVTSSREIQSLADRVLSLEGGRLQDGLK